MDWKTHYPHTLGQYENVRENVRESEIVSAVVNGHIVMVVAICETTLLPFKLLLERVKGGS